MTKSVLIAEVSKKVEGMTPKQIEVIVETVFDGIKGALAQGEKVEIRGFGTFRIRQREGRAARNPKTGEKLEVPPKKALHFKIGKALHNALNCSE